MRCSLLIATLLSYPLSTLASPEVIQGPFTIDAADTVFIQRETDKDYPLGLYWQSERGVVRVDTYPVEGDEPTVESVFFTTIQNRKNVIVLLSWHQVHRAEGINGYAWQVYGYIYENHTLVSNSLINNDPQLRGFDGELGGAESVFKYKNAAAIKSRLQQQYR
ncbi:hypothetical protein [Siccibacter turicensis]|uniref:Uncharacterized protein n=1 Tax=Siccibacter turicensis TaxID=357233 RepID=C7C503_9ENTR|nr:hypothetical protein [Siccibacter turicensis]CAZ90470.1 hypothetical protein [Siccibacter turicensis LMG 23730]